MKIIRISGSAIRKATVDLRCISLCRLLRSPRLMAAVRVAAMSAISGSVSRLDERRTPAAKPASLFYALRLVAHEPFDFAGRPVQGFLQRLALEVAHRHLGHDPLI